jgi:2-polyprenyl-3-methyl-5-hydroxy-6-metoxy-1,4-benzoquinol methylase
MATDTKASFNYVGNELDLFQHARNWKSYFARQLAPFVRGDVLEVGAGIGGTTRVLNRGAFSSWTCLEPDHELADRLRQSLSSYTEIKTPPSVITGVVDELPLSESFDTVLYIDVLEHIERDADEVARAAKRLRPGGHIVTLSPAHNFLFTPFDEAIGHFRRYNRPLLRKLTPPECRLRRLRYLDSTGLLASLGNKLLLKSAHPTAGQIRFWDRVLVRCSRVTDLISAYQIGKSIVAIWQKKPECGEAAS